MIEKSVLGNVGFAHLPIFQSLSVYFGIVERLNKSGLAEAPLDCGDGERDDLLVEFFPQGPCSLFDRGS